jgi:hypothetical protein
MNLAQEYWRRAQTFKKLAMQTPNPEHREAIQQIGDTWAKMARDLERREDAKRNERPPDAPERLTGND